MNGTPLVPSVVRALAVGFALLGASAAQAQTPSVTFVVGAGSSGGSRISGLSADGHSAAGDSALSLSIQPGFLWTADSGRYDFGLEAGVPAITRTYAISGDGHTTVGYSSVGETTTQTAFRWSGPGTFQSLGTLSGTTDSRSLGVSGDGSIVVGRASGPGGVQPQAFRWTSAGGMQALGPQDSEANAISRNGTVVVGETAVSSGAAQAFRWTQAGGLQPLPPLPGTYYSFARAVSADGANIVGITASASVDYPTRWHNGQAENLGLPTGWFEANPLGVSDDGQVIVGNYSSISTSYGAAIWTPSTGFMPLADYLSSFGITLPTGVWLETCTGISADGMTFVGHTFGPAGIAEGYVATIPAPGVTSVLGAALLLSVRRRRN